MDLKSTVDGMLSADYKERFVAELTQLNIRMTKLEDMLKHYYNGELDFEPKTPIKILEAQRQAMAAYFNLLTVRAEIEEVDYHLEA